MNVYVMEVNVSLGMWLYKNISYKDNIALFRTHFCYSVNFS